MGKNGFVSVGVWVGIVTTVWVVAWIIAEAIPVFNDLLGLISALFASWFTYGLSGVFWLFLNYGRYRESKKKMFLTVLNTTIFLIGAVIVSFQFIPLPLLLFLRHQCRREANGIYSAGWDCTRLGRLFILMRAVRMGVFPVLTIRNRRHDGWKGWWRRIWLIPRYICK